MKVMIMPNFDKQHTASCTKRVCERLQELHIEVLLAAETKNYLTLELAHYDEFETQLQHCDAIIAIGGDGTIIHSAKHAVSCDKPIFGINAGRLGFLAALEQNELQMLGKLVEHNYRIEERMMLDVIHCASMETKHYLAFNDVVVSKGSLSRMVDIDVHCNERFVGSYRADGMIFSTPTGSTAYALSAGGPIVEPSLESISMTPISPQSLFGRSILFAADNMLKVNLGDDSDTHAYLTVDGEEAIRLEKHDDLLIQKSITKVKMIILNEKQFYEVLNEKFITRAEENRSSNTT